MTVAESQPTTWLLRWPGRAMWVLITLLGSLVSAILIARGRWMYVLFLMAAVPVLLIVQRYPLAVMALWFVVAPFLTDIEDGGRLKLLYWSVHRILPLAALAVVLISHSTRAGFRRLGRLRWPELILVVYLVVTAVSILYTSDTAVDQFRHLYDRVAVPMIFYVLIRLVRPGAEALKTISYILVFILLSQATVGLLSWVAPSLVPDRFLTRVGERTIGTLDHANVFAIVALASGALFLHISRYTDDWRKRAGMPLFLLSIAMAVLSFSRASWLAALVVVVGVAFVYPRIAAQVSLISAVALGVLLLAGGHRWLGDYLEQRFYSTASEESALSRLPVVYASLRMIETKPLTGWGYGNFDRYDLQFQSRVGDLFVPEKDHASHNLFLTLGAEQGLIGLLAYVGIGIYWLLRTPRAMARLKSDDMLGRRLLVILWAVVAGHVLVSNFANMRQSFGLAVWWLSLALIGNLVTGATSVSRPDSDSRQVAAGGSP